MPLRRAFFGLSQLNGRPSPRLQRTDLPSKPQDDYTGRDLDRQRLYARVYRASSGTGSGKWCWTLAEQGPIAGGQPSPCHLSSNAPSRAGVRGRVVLPKLSHGTYRVHSKGAASLATAGLHFGVDDGLNRERGMFTELNDGHNRKRARVQGKIRSTAVDLAEGQNCGTEPVRFSATFP
jgi:hypothetical protein